MKALILSAGFGKRLRPFTEHCAKPALPFLGLPLIAYPLFYISQLKPLKWVFNLHYKPKTIVLALQYLTVLRPDLFEKKIFFSKEDPLILGTGGGIKQAEPFLSSSKNFIVANADSLFFLSQKKNTLKKVLEKHVENQALATLLCAPFEICRGITKNEKRKGVEVSKDGNQILGFKEKKDVTCQESLFLHYTGLQVFSEKIFNFIPAHQSSHIFQDILLPLMGTSHPIQAFVETDLRWFEVGEKKAYIDACQTCLSSVSSKKEDKNKDFFVAREILSLYRHYYPLQKEFKQWIEQDLSKDLSKDFNFEEKIQLAPWL